MSVRELTSAMLDEILEEDIVPAMFPEATSGQPTLAIVTGVPGAGAARCTARVLAPAPANVVVLSTELLAGFHPDFLVASSPSDLSVVREAAVAWSAALIRRARQDRRSLIIEGDGLSVPAVTGTASLFAREGYRTHIVIVAGVRAQTLLALVSAYARELRDGGIGTPVDVAGHDAARANVHSIVEQTAQAETIDRLSILDHRGVTVFDTSGEVRVDARGTGTQQLLAAEGARLTPLESAEWMSELRRITEFEMSSTRSHPLLVDCLIELHEVGLNEVVPRLAVPRGSAMVSRQELEYGSRLVQLRERRSAHAAPVDLAAPVVTPASVERDGIGR
ncbi:MAG: zeta toxin family protein [Microbacterium sp.]|uniref:zeta toxin family protein n=1 Tax=Microbacterium sp. TaxID=51671 RepID=UPI001ACB97C3|nr:zeta toxin family protein [Microbacterium sp.]MBN9154702.1 zeta toxin family protein [Microbacterium sp.]